MALIEIAGSVGARKLAVVVRRLAVLIAASLAVVSVVATLGARASGPGATQVALHFPTAAVPLPGGGFLIADSQNEVIRQVDASGVITTVAGDGIDCRNTVQCDANGADKVGDGGPATDAQLDDPTDAVPYQDGSFLIADATWNLAGGDGTVRLVNASGIISTIAGGGSGTCPGAADAIGDGCPATDAILDNPTAAIPTADGGFLIADAGASRIRYVNSQGIISTVAGGVTSVGGVCAQATDGIGDGCPATQAWIGAPTAAIPLDIADAAVSTGTGNGFLIADQLDCVVRYVNAESGGTITTVAGVPPTAQQLGDLENNCSQGQPTTPAGPATSVELDGPTDARPTADGGFLIADAGDCSVFKVSSISNGTLSTVIPEEPGCSGSGVLENFGGVTAAIPTPGGGFLATTPTNQVDQVAASGQVTTVAGTGASSGGGPPPPSPPACTLSIKSSTVLLSAPTRKATGKPAATPVGALTLSASCDQAASLTLTGVVTELIGKKPTHGKQRTKTFPLGNTSASATKPNVAVTVIMKLPKKALSALRGGGRESVTITMTATDANGTSKATATTGRLRAKR